MGLIQAAIGAISGSLADQWIDFLTVPVGISQTAAVFPAVLSGKDQNRGSNIRQSEAVITNGSKIIVPEGYSLLTFQDGALTSLTTVAGAYIWDSHSIESKSLFIGDDKVSELAKLSWERFKYGGRPSSQQTALFVSLKELPNNKFGTQSPIYWDDAYLNTQVGATARGTYSLQIIDPIKFAINFLPASTLQNQEVFDFSDPSNDYSNQIFNEVVASLASALNFYANENNRSRRISSIQANITDFSDFLGKAVQDAFGWEKERGIVITKASLVSIDYDEQTRSILTSIQRADALSGVRGESNLKASIAAGFEGAGQNAGPSGIFGLGLATGGLGVNSQVFQGLSTDNQSSQSPDEKNALLENLKQLKLAFESGLISEDDYNNAKSKALGL